MLLRCMSLPVDQSRPPSLPRYPAASSTTHAISWPVHHPWSHPTVSALSNPDHMGTLEKGTENIAREKQNLKPACFLVALLSARSPLPLAQAATKHTHAPLKIVTEALDPHRKPVQLSVPLILGSQLLAHRRCITKAPS